MRIATCILSWIGNRDMVDDLDPDLWNTMSWKLGASHRGDVASVLMGVHTEDRSSMEHSKPMDEVLSDRRRRLYRKWPMSRKHFPTLALCDAYGMHEKKVA